MRVGGRLGRVWSHAKPRPGGNRANRLRASVSHNQRNVSAQDGRPGAALLGTPLAEQGEGMFRHACAMGLEGIVSKKLTSRYKSGACKSWLKVKNPEYQRRSGLACHADCRHPVGAIKLGRALNHQAPCVF
jgi:hypothetical protein